MHDADTLTGLSVYSPRPWLLEEASPLLAPLFANAPSEVFEERAEHFFGAEPWVWFIEEGLVATYATSPGMQNQMTGLFGRHAVLGGFKALLHGGRMTPLVTKALLQTRARRVSAEAFRRYLETDDAVAACVLRHMLVQHEQQMEGMLLNDLLPVDVRLARIIETLYLAAGGRLSGELTPLPVPVTVLDLAEMAHADRAFVSRILSGWRRNGAFARTGRRLSFSAAILEEGRED